MDEPLEPPGEVLPRERWTRTRVPLGAPGVLFDWEAAFGRRAPRVLDLGCGNGLYLLRSALARPDHDHLGVDLVPPAIRMASLRAGQRGLANCKYAWGDATLFALERVEAASIDELHLYHPQPYYERGLAGRRQLAPVVLAAIHRALVPGGLFVFQTDNPAYWRYARSTAMLLFRWDEPAGPWPDAPQGRTQREASARAQGLKIYRASCRALELEPAERDRRVSLMPQPDFDANKAGFRGARRGSKENSRGARRGSKEGSRGTRRGSNENSRRGGRGRGPRPSG
jgi:tRNA (guanine-N7-)-methyltransferase